MGWRRGLILGIVLLLGAPLAMAQHKDWKSWYGEVSGNYTLPMVSGTDPNGNSVDPLDDGWGISAGAIYKPKDWPLGIFMELGYNAFDVSNDALRLLDVPGGDADIWNLTGGFHWTTETNSIVNFYVQGGIGWYYISARLTSPGVGWTPGWCGWYWCYPPGYVPVTNVLASESTTRFGYNAAIGLSFETGQAGEVYIEASYHWAQTTNETTEYLPISVGFRW